MKTVLLAAALCIAVAVPLAAQTGRQKIPVFITTAQSVDGFTDPDKGRSDSTKDLTEKVRDSKHLRLVANEADATLVLAVLSRDTKHQWGHVLGAQNRSSLTVQLTAGTFTADFTGTGGASGVFSGHGKAAGEVVKQLEKWTQVNRDRLPSQQQP